jgi:AraC-like DNA-binding protein
VTYFALTKNCLALNTDIRSFYTPIQPTVKQTAEQVSYTEFLPQTALQPFVYCYWQLKTNSPLTAPFHYRVVADGCIDVFFELTDTAENFVMGFCKKFTEFPLGKTFHYFGIRFLPTMFPQLFKVNALTLSNRFEHLQNVVPGLSGFIAAHLHADQNPDQIKALLDQYLLTIVSKQHFDNDSRLYNAIDIILKKSGVVNIETDIDTGISQRQLRRLFEYYIGDTPKTFSKVVRFQNILRAKPSTQSLRQNKLFFDVGYYDQAHFIKEFRHFYGVTPAKAFGR